jgi:nucleotide-binding universal stress UspA family protein
MIVSPKRILWPADFSPLSLKAADYARGFREIFGADLHVVHVCEPMIVPPPGFPSLPEADIHRFRERAFQAASEQLKRWTDEVFPGDTALKREILVGKPWSEICKYAGSSGVDLIIIATHGLSGLKHILMGSVAERVVQHAACPVLVVKSVERDFTI